jgi:hypothetical protein
MQVSQLKQLISNLDDQDEIEFEYADFVDGNVWVELELSTIDQPEDSHVIKVTFFEK